jgi:hypothetical protein
MKETLDFSFWQRKKFLQLYFFSISTTYVIKFSIYLSVVGTATGYGLDDRGIGVRVPVGSRIFFSPSRPDRLWGPPNLLSPGVTRPGREADHSPPASAEVKRMWIYTSTPPYALMAQCLISQAQGQLCLFYLKFFFSF